jgi:hypothetical protein
MILFMDISWIEVSWISGRPGRDLDIRRWSVIRLCLPFVADPVDPMSFRNPSERIVGETSGAAY